MQQGHISTNWQLKTAKPRCQICTLHLLIVQQEALRIVRKPKHNKSIQGKQGRRQQQMKAGYHLVQFQCSDHKGATSERRHRQLDAALGNNSFKPTGRAQKAQSISLRGNVTCNFIPMQLKNSTKETENN